ncbi:Elongin-A2 [Plecturocebus cupreus]
MPESSGAVVTANIRAAHENKPQGRQTKMICFNSVAETPDAPRRQEKSAGAADPGKRQHQARSPSHEKQPPPSSGAGAAARQRPPGLPEKRAYACLSCSNAQVTPEAKIPKQAAKKVAPADGQGHSRLQEKILPTIISTLRYRWNLRGGGPMQSQCGLRNDLPMDSGTLAWCKVALHNSAGVQCWPLGFGLPYLATASLLGGHLEFRRCVTLSDRFRFGG